MQETLNWNKVKEDKVSYEQNKAQGLNGLTPYFKPPQGEFNITWLDNGMIGLEVPDKFKPGKTCKMVTFKINYAGTEMKWEMKYSHNSKAPFSEIEDYAIRIGGELKNRTTRFRCKGEKTERVLTILD